MGKPNPVSNSLKRIHTEIENDYKFKIETKSDLQTSKMHVRTLKPSLIHEAKENDSQIPHYSIDESVGQLRVNKNSFH